MQDVVNVEEDFSIFIFYNLNKNAFKTQFESCATLDAITVHTRYI